VCEECGCADHEHPQAPAHGTSQVRRLDVRRDVREANASAARHNREHLRRIGVVAVNLVSSPGAGKTTLLVRTLQALSAKRPVAVIEGDQHTDNDARRVAETGVPVVQINTGTGCHLDAIQIHDALHRLAPPKRALLFVENVGNLICPAGFDLGQAADVALLSVAEGDDKPEKYPDAFRTATAMVLTKVDLLPHVDFDRERCFRLARALNPHLPIFELSARTGEGLDAWLDWLAKLHDGSV
jgi:hydrogenase nickel incorporation protein HypB